MYGLRLDESEDKKADQMIFECVGALFYWLRSERCSEKEAREIIHHNVDRALDKAEKN